MKTINKIRFIKLGYLLILVCYILLSFQDSKRGFMDGFNEVENSSSDLSFLEVSLVLVITFIAVRILVYLYRFIDSVSLNEIFSSENIRRLFLMAWYCICLPFLIFGFNLSKFLHNKVLGYGLFTKIISGVDFEFWLLIFGITLLTIAFVIKKVIDLKQENDLTI